MGKKLKNLAKAATAAGAAYLGSKYLKGKGYKNVHETGAITKTPGGKWKPGIGGKQHIPNKLYDKAWGSGVMFKKGGSIKAKTGTMIKAKKGFGKKLAKAAVAAGAAYAGSKYLKAQGMKGNVSKTAAMEDANIGVSHFPGKIKKAAHNLFSGTMAISKEGGSIKAKAGKMVKARGGVIVNTKLNGPLFTETF